MMFDLQQWGKKLNFTFSLQCIYVGYLYPNQVGLGSFLSDPDLRKSSGSLRRFRYLSTMKSTMILHLGMRYSKHHSFETAVFKREPTYLNANCGLSVSKDVFSHNKGKTKTYFETKNILFANIDNVETNNFLHRKLLLRPL
jgi:hypothetical protein